MDYESRIDLIYYLFKQKFNINIKELDSDTTFNEIGIDSFGMIELIFELEKLTGKPLLDEEIEKLYRISDIINLIENK